MRDFDKRIRPSKPVAKSSSFFLQVHSEADGEDKPHHHVYGPLSVLHVEKRTATINGGEVVEEVSLYHL